MSKDVWWSEGTALCILDFCTACSETSVTRTNSLNMWRRPAVFSV